MNLQDRVDNYLAMFPNFMPMQIFNGRIAQFGGWAIIITVARNITASRPALITRED